VVGCWLLVVGCWLLVVGCWLSFVICYSPRPRVSSAPRPRVPNPRFSQYQENRRLVNSNAASDSGISLAKSSTNW
jgi:hypothetical protein